MKFKSKKGFNINQVPMLGLALVIIAVVLGLGATILGQVKSTQCTYTYSALNGCLNSTGGTGGTLGDTLASNITSQGVQSVTTLSAPSCPYRQLTFQPVSDNKSSNCASV